MARSLVAEYFKQQEEATRLADLERRLVLLQVDYEGHIRWHRMTFLQRVRWLLFGQK